MHLDHDHKTGEFRGWLCHRCNVGLGMLGDDTPSLSRALKYLTRYEERGSIDSIPITGKEDIK